MAQQLIDQRREPGVFIGQAAEQEAAQALRTEAERIKSERRGAQRAAQALQRQCLAGVDGELVEVIVELRQGVVQRQAVEPAMRGFVDVALQHRVAREQVVQRAAHLRGALDQRQHAAQQPQAKVRGGVHSK